MRIVVFTGFVMAYKKKYKVFTPKTQKQRKQERLDAFEKIGKGIKNLTSSEGWKQYLRVQGQFHDYSFNNIMLIITQFPRAVKLAGFSTWKKVGRQVNKGERGIRIIRPKFSKQTDDATGDTKTVLSGFTFASVFDVSQTSGAPLPFDMPLLGGESDLYDLLKASSPISVLEKEDCRGAHGYYHSKDHTITILSTLSSVDKANTFLHERAHSILHQGDEGRRVKRNVKELEAESVAFTVSQVFGIDSSESAFEYLAGFGQGEDVVKKIEALGNRIQKASRIILDEVHDFHEKEQAHEQNHKRKHINLLKEA